MLVTDNLTVYDDGSVDVDEGALLAALESMPGAAERRAKHRAWRREVEGLRAGDRVHSTDAFYARAYDPCTVVSVDGDAAVVDFGDERATVNVWSLRLTDTAHATVRCSCWHERAWHVPAADGSLLCDVEDCDCPGFTPAG